MDKEEGTQLTLAEHIQSMLDSKGWEYARSKFDQRILDLQNINNLDMTKPETLGIQLAARKMAVDEMWGWLRNDIVGFVEQQNVAQGKIDEKIDSYIGRE
jgi:hypothetical protein